MSSRLAPHSPVHPHSRPVSLYSPHAPQHEGLGVWGTRLDLPPLFHLPGPRAQGTGPGPLKVWGGIPLWIRSASQTVQDPRTSQSPAPFIPFTPCFLYLLQRSFTIPHTKVGRKPTPCSGKTGGKSRSGRRLLTWETATGGGGVPSPQIPAPTASNIYITLFWHVRCELNLTSILLLLN